MSVDERGDDGGSGYHGLAEGPVLGKLMIGKKRGFWSEEMRKKKGSQGGLSEKRFRWNRRLCDAKKDIGWGSWGHCSAI